MKFLLEQIINSNYVKYDTLIPIVNEAFKGSSSSNINIYIDLYSILKPLYKNTNYNINNYSLVTSCIINMVAHYREFFRTRYNTNSKFYLIISKNCPYVNNQFYMGYNSKNAYRFSSNELVNDMVLNNIELLKILCPYLPDIHFINSQFEVGVVIYDMICRNEVFDINTPSLIITKDVYNYQLAAMRDNIFILRPKKYKGEDLSFYINSMNLMRKYCETRNIKYNDDLKCLMPGLFTMIMTLTSVKERNIKTLVNINVASSLLNNAISQYKILNGYNNIPENVYDNIDNSQLKINKIDFVNRFKAIDIQFQHYIYANSVDARSIKLLNLVDDDNIRFINNKYFKDNPLDLNRL